MFQFATTCVDNFFKHPDEVINLADTLDYKPEPKGMWPGARSPELHLVSPSFKNAVCTKYLKLHLSAPMIGYQCAAYFQKIGAASGGSGEGWVHNDTPHLHTTIIYLTPNISDDSGTSIFIPKPDATAATVAGTNAASAVPSREVFMPVSKTEGFLKKEQFYKSQINLEEAETYRLKNNSPFKEVIRFANIYNRCIGFDGSHWHSSGKFDNVDKEEERLTLIIFWRTIIGPQTGLQRTKMSPI